MAIRSNADVGFTLTFHYDNFPEQEHYSAQFTDQEEELANPQKGFLSDRCPVQTHFDHPPRRKFLMYHRPGIFEQQQYAHDF